MKAILLALCLTLVAGVAASEETLWGAGDRVSTDLRGWPDLMSLSYTGYPSQALIVDTVGLTQGWGSGNGLDEDGSYVTTGDCSLANHATDAPCPGVLRANAAYTMDIGTARAQWYTQITIDGANDDTVGHVCRRTGDLTNHSVRNASDAIITSAAGDSWPMILWDASADVYRWVWGDNASGFDCTTGVGSIDLHIEPYYDSATADKLQIAYEDGIHLGTYGMRFLAQRALLTTWEDQYPATLGLTNLMAGYQEDGCALFTTTTDATPSTTAVSNRAQSSNTPFLGAGCDLESTDATMVAETDVVTAIAGEWYVGQVMMNFTDGDAETRELTFNIQDNAGNQITTAAFWLDGSSSGNYITDADDTDATGTISGAMDMNKRTCYGGCTLRFIFQMEAADTGFKVHINWDDTGDDLIVDEMWIRKKVFQDANRHYIFQEGQANIQVLTDSRGNTAAYERLIHAFDYMLGFTTKNGDSRTSIRPDLKVAEAPSVGSWWSSGQRLGDIVGDNDSDKGYDGVASTDPTLASTIDDYANYCVILFGANDMVQNPEAFPGFAASVPDLTNKHLYFGDQLKGFEEAANEMGCQPIIIADPEQKTDTASNLCVTVGDVDDNCGDWWNTTWVDVLHNGIR